MKYLLHREHFSLKKFQNIACVAWLLNVGLVLIDADGKILTLQKSVEIHVYDA